MQTKTFILDAINLLTALIKYNRMNINFVKSMSKLYFDSKINFFFLQKMKPIFLFNIDIYIYFYGKYSLHQGFVMVL